MGNNKDRKGVSAPKLGAKGTQQPQVSRSNQPQRGNSQQARNAPATNSGKVFVCKLGESQIPVDHAPNDTVLTVLRRARFPDGVFKTNNGASINNLIEAAEADVSSGRATNIAACFSDIRVNAAPSTLETPVPGGAILTLIPRIAGG